ncbi:MAG: Serine palmitoyltransferase, partial [uncultured Gemmatimonadetes bacterium]
GDDRGDGAAYRGPLRQVPPVHGGAGDDGPRAVPVLPADRGVARHRGGDPGRNQDHGGLQQLPGPHPSPVRAGKGPRRAVPLRLRQHRQPLSERHPRHPRGAGKPPGRPDGRRGGAGVQHRLPDQPGHHQRPGHPRLAGGAGPVEPRLAGGRRAAGRRRAGALPARRHGRPAPHAGPAPRRQRRADRHRRRVQHGGQHRRPAHARGDQGGVRRPPAGGRRPLRRRAGGKRRGHGRALRPAGPGGPHHDHLLQVVRLHRRGGGGAGRRDPLPEAPRAPAHLQRQHARLGRGHGAGLPGRHAARAGAPRAAVEERPLPARRPAVAGLRHRGLRDAHHPGGVGEHGKHLHLLARAVRFRRVHQPGAAPRRPRELVPAAHLGDGHAHRRAAGPGARGVRPRGQAAGAGGRRGV